LRDDLHQWQADGVGVALVGSGNATFARAFAEDFDLDLPLFVDPELVSFRAARLRRGVEAVASTGFLRNALRAYRSGARQTGIEGDAWQLGGVFVFDAVGRLHLAHRSGTAGDHPPAVEIREAVEVAVKGAAPALEERQPMHPLARVANASRAVLDASPLGSFDRLGFERHALGFDPNDLEVDLHGKRCLVTGANSGIGYATSERLAELGASVDLLCRNEERGQAAVDAIREATGNRNVRLVRLDVSDLDDVERVAALYGGETVDVLVHNAGVLPDERIESPQGLELTWATHVAGPHLLTKRLRSALERSGAGRIVWVSSGGMLTRRLQVRDPQWTKRDYDGVLAYAETKRAQVVLSERWAALLLGSGVVSNAMHPGWADTPAVQSSLPRFHAVTERILRTPAEGADTVVWLAAAERAGQLTGEFFFDRRAVTTHWLPTTRERQADRDALWQQVESATERETAAA
jgi:NAD(P)-dependent dehydrogenase (short-subunit alcohol dehydrogenase family)